MKRVLLVGESNPLSSDPDYALYPYPPNSAGGRLARMLGMSPKEFLATFYRANLFDVEPVRWSKERAHARLVEVVHEYHAIPYCVDTVILLGTRVSAAVGERFLMWKPTAVIVNFDRAGLGVVEFISVPHPSGRCRLWNDPANVRRLRRAIRRVLA